MISEATKPQLVALPTLFVIALASAPNTIHAVLWWSVAAAGISIAPHFFVLRGVRRGDLTDRRVSVREQRLIPLLFALGCVAGSLALLLLLQASPDLVATVAAVTVAMATATLVTRHWKISMHLVGMSGALTVLVLMFGRLYLSLMPLLVIGAWARWKVGAHTPMQTAAGVALGASATITLFWVFGLF
jgi:hypothetical protein